jgi:hypothetical protein
MPSFVSVATWLGLAALVLVAGVVARSFFAEAARLSLVRKASRTIYPDAKVRPKIAGGSSYAWPKFMVDFPSKNDYLCAQESGKNAALLQYIQQACATKTQTRGTRAKPRVVAFNAEYAVTFRYPGYEADQAASYREQVKQEDSQREARDA